jgi:hypothetical protein
VEVDIKLSHYGKVGNRQTQSIFKFVHLFTKEYLAFHRVLEHIVVESLGLTVLIDLYQSLFVVFPKLNEVIFQECHHFMKAENDVVAHEYF